MKFGYIKAATFTPKIKVADVEYNTENILSGIKLADENNAELLVFPELCVTGYTAGDLFYTDVLLSAAKAALIKIAQFTADKKMLVFVGVPFKKDGLIYNTAAACANGKVLGLVPKTYLPNYNEFYEKRCFAATDGGYSEVKLGEDEKGDMVTVPFSRNLIFCDEFEESFKVAAEICEDLWTPVPPSISHAVHGARVIVNLSASDENTGKIEYRRNLVATHSSKTVSVYVYANAGDGESTTDTVFSGHSLIAENGEIIAETVPFDNGLATACVDLEYLDYERSKVFNQDFTLPECEYKKIPFNASRNGMPERVLSKTPFIPEGEEGLILTMQAKALEKRLVHTHSQKLVVGLSGGLDSTLAAIVSVTAAGFAGKSTKDVLAITMPCFGTTSRTYLNSIALAKSLGASLKKIDITKSVKRHLKDIKHDGSLDAAYENSQARERTQVLMDVANMQNGLVVGTGDLSELALGWATYNGDHMSMYAVNGSVPKTLVRRLVEYYRDNSKGKLKAVLTDILDTPVSPELLPPDKSEIKQKTEDIVGPYALHDFFLYYMVKRGFSPEKIYYSALKTFEGEFDSATVLKWLKVFVRRFFSQQFKRSCMPDGVKIGAVTLSPRGNWRMPSDAVCALWLKQLDEISL